MYKIKFTDGTVGIMTLSKGAEIRKEVEKLNDGHEFDVVAGYDVVTPDELPKSRNYRNAWTHTLDIDLERAKVCQKDLMVAKAYEVVPMDDFGEQDFKQVKQEIDAIDFALVENLDDLYNTWPQSIEARSERRVYVI